jgi:hypothetical protein
LPSITPDYKPHKDLESDIRAYTAGLGFKTSEATYHTVMAAEVVKILQRRFTPPALYIRARADRVAVHGVRCVEFELEAKTHQSTRFHDMTLELLPLVFHIAKLEVGVDCLYAYRNPFLDENMGFWVSAIPPIRDITIPDRLEWKQLRGWVDGLINQFFPETKVLRKPYCGNGSGDPYLIIDRKDVLRLRDWRGLIQDRTQVVAT